LENALKTFKATFASVDPLWGDAARREFEETYLEPMEPHVKDMLAMMSRLATVFAGAEHECGTSFGNSDD